MWLLRKHILKKKSQISHFISVVLLAWRSWSYSQLHYIKNTGAQPTDKHPGGSVSLENRPNRVECNEFITEAHPYRSTLNTATQ